MTSTPQWQILTGCSQAPPHETLPCSGPELKIAAVRSVLDNVAASEAIAAVRGPACKRAHRAIQDVLIKLLELHSGVEASGKPGAVHTFAEFESDLIRMRMRIRQGMAVARVKDKLKGEEPKLSPMQSRELRRMHDTGDYSISDLSDVVKMSRPTIYRTSHWGTTAHLPKM